MKIIVLAAGQSQRFKQKGFLTPKFLIPLDGLPMIQHVLEMFDPIDEFYIIINRDHKKAHPDIERDLKKLVKNCQVAIIEPFTCGPVESVLKAEFDFPPDEPIIITYCDFSVTWNYRRFLRDVQGYDGGIPTFKGFHPASFGGTSYCYLKENDQHELTALSEKKAFTTHRHEEPASAGIYYFNKWSMFKRYAFQFLQDRSMWQGLNELYVSLLFSKMISDKLKVKVFPVERFICWGTPEDVEQFNYWCRYFRSYNPEIEPVAAFEANLIPMAGKGERFQKAGYRVNKPFIQVSNLPMVKKACSSFPNAHQWVFVMRHEDIVKYPVKEIFSNAFSKTEILDIPGETSGQAATCLTAEQTIAPGNSLFITSCDYVTVYNQNDWRNLKQDHQLDAIIWTYRMKNLPVKDPKNFAYCRVDAEGFVTEIVEKQTVSSDPGNDHMVVGSFWFRKASDFFSLARTIIAENHTVNGEHYIGNGMNLLLKNNKKIRVFEIDQWISFGDPFELDIYFYWESYFHRERNTAF